MESAAKIRRLILRDGRSIRSVSRDTGLSRNTVKKYLNDATPPRYQRSQAPVRHKLQGFEERLRSLFEQDQKRARRERRTAVKLYEQLVEDGYTGSYSPVYRFVKTLKADGSELLHAYIPLHFKAGDALQFDWSEEHVVLGGVEQKIKVAHFRLCHSRKSFIVAYPGEPQEMVLDAFVRALAFYGGVPRRLYQRHDYRQSKDHGNLCIALKRPDGLTNRKGAGRTRYLSDVQMKELGEIVETGPDPAVDGVVRWRRIDLKRVIEARFGVIYSEREYTIHVFWL